MFRRRNGSTTPDSTPIAGPEIPAEHGDGRCGRDDGNGPWRAATPPCFDGRVRRRCGRRQSFLDLQPRVADVAQAVLAILRETTPHQPPDDRG